MKIHDKVFGELEYEYGWSKDTVVQFQGSDVEIALMIDGEEDGVFDEEQYKAYESLLEHWEELQPKFLQAILAYYKELRSDLGYDVEENEEYPDIEDTEQLNEKIELTAINIPYGDINEGRDIGVTFDCSWNDEDGVGIRLINEEITEVGYQDVAL